MFSKSIIAASLLTAVTAHQNFHQFWVNGVSPGYQVSIRMPPSNSPVLDVASDNITCNVNGNVVPSGVNTTAANEGDAITVQWDSSTHPGPIQHYLFGPVDDASMATGIGSWFKIDEYIEVNGTWASNLMDAGNMSYTFNLPTGMATGEYLLRSEMLALHSAQTVGGAQWYIGCAQLSITGTSGDSCGPSIELPGDYNATDPSIYIPDIYYGFDISTYTPPGGAIATCGAAGAGATGAASATAIATSAVSSAVASSSAAAVSSAVIESSSIASSVEVSSSAVLPTSSVAAIVTSAPSTLVTATSAPAATSSAVEVGDDECEA
ncbi:putative glycoside hydrolase family 61 protein [Botrytis fragariae]|uniref:AA9 family lytic polysaccharide monooxygenase n=1 Tax=Botrytis fragariae TaxID=1964551 RepID=A0A8H6AR91_9HELO|nr:putative glycoside hydrolase family 61 protein [Botrytis fragariae]KAF5872121.1 putative glycoside hydrolase family 61 protein [Botrytis fragariae]